MNDKYLLREGYEGDDLFVREYDDLDDDTDDRQNDYQHHGDQHVEIVEEGLARLVLLDLGVQLLLPSRLLVLVVLHGTYIR